jgi:hypothetical protein
MTRKTNFKCHVDRDGYRLIPSPPLSRGIHFMDAPLHLIQPSRIVGKGGKLKTVWLDSYPDAYSEFANIMTEDGLLAFIEKFGPLTGAGVAGKKGEVVPELLDQAENMKDLQHGKTARQIHVATHRASILFDRQTATLEIVPMRLLDALWLQLSFARNRRTEARTCPQCGTLFQVGGATKRRRDTQFCCREHQIMFNSLKRSR